MLIMEKRKKCDFSFFEHYLERQRFCLHSARRSARVRAEGRAYGALSTLAFPLGGRCHEVTEEGRSSFCGIPQFYILHSTFYIYHLSFAVAASAQKKAIDRFSEVVLG